MNANFWLTSDDALLDPDGGGMVIWEQPAPLDWDFEEFNRQPDRIMAFLEEAKSPSQRVPHRQNRMVLFDSNLCHRTDDLCFHPGYENRRINVTMLYGHRR